MKKLSWFCTIFLSITCLQVQASGGEAHYRSGGDWYTLLGIIIFTVAYMLFTYLILWLRYRKESKENVAKFVLAHHRLNLKAGWACTHYGCPLLSLMMAVFFMTISLLDYTHGDGKLFSPSFGGIISFFLVFALIGYCCQRHRLKFKPIATTKSVKMIQRAVKKIAIKNVWTINHMDDDYIETRTCDHSIFRKNEQIFVVFDKEKVWINNIFGLDPSIMNHGFPLGHHSKKNFLLLQNAIESISENNDKVFTKQD